MQRGRCRYAGLGTKCTCACDSVQHAEVTINLILDYFQIERDSDDHKALYWAFTTWDISDPRELIDQQGRDGNTYSYTLYDLSMIALVLQHPEILEEIRSTAVA